MYTCRDSACTDCRPASTYQGGCDSFVNSVHACAANPNTAAATPAYGVRMRWVSNAQGCVNEPDAIDYWPLGSPFAMAGEGSCVDVPLGMAGTAYYTFSTSPSIPATPSSWSPFYAVKTYYENDTMCADADPSTVKLVTMTNSNSCVLMVLSLSFSPFSFLLLLFLFPFLVFLSFLVLIGFFNRDRALCSTTTCV